VRPARRAPAAFALALVAVAGCAPGRLRLPSGTGTPLSDPAPVIDEAIGHCAALRTFTAEIRLSGRAGGHRIRVRLVAGLAAPDGIRLEAVAPVGQPLFILASAGNRTTLLLPRDDRVLTGQPPAAILEALAGVSLTPPVLRSLLAGCPGGAIDREGVRAIGSEWVVAATADGGMAYFRRLDGRWRLTALRGPSLEVEVVPGAGPQPASVRLTSPPGRDGASFDLVLRLEQVETNSTIPDEAFTVRVPADAVPMTLDELRQAGPLRDRSAS
jgi:outer membrane lipoprotein-sorting protein